MDRINKILVVNDTIDGISTALGKAALIEHYTGAEVEVAQVIWDHVENEPIADHTKANLIAAFVAAERNKLRDLMKPYRDRIAWSEERVIWSKHPADAIADEVQRNRIDLVIKPVGVHHGFADYLTTPLDWKILRTVDCPVLISKDSSWHTGGNVLAAVDVADEAHTALTRAVLQTAAQLAAVLGGALSVVTAYPDLKHAEAYYEAASEYAVIKEESVRLRERGLHDLLTELAIAPVETRVEAGAPPAVIKRLADALAPVVTVIGTSARHGLARLVMGNTAEDVLNQLAGDILTVRVN